MTETEKELRIQLIVAQEALRDERAKHVRAEHEMQTDIEDFYRTKNCGDFEDLQSLEDAQCIVSNLVDQIEYMLKVLHKEGIFKEDYNHAK